MTRRCACGRFGEVPSYGTRHRPPGPGTGAPLHDLTGNSVYPADVYEHPEWYAAGHPLDRSAAAVARYARGRPEAEVAIFRAVPCGIRRINNGDWVSTVQAYTIDHGRATGSFDEQDMCVIAARVPARCLHTDGNSLFEWGYNCAPIAKARVAYRPRKRRSA
jgi:hypothetical protein